MRSDLAFRVSAVTILVSFPMFFVCTLTQAQVRGVYPVGMSATNSGVTPEAGISYSNVFIFFSRDEEKGAHGEVLATGQNSIMMDMNSFVWVSKKEIAVLGGAVFSASATLPVANNSLSSDVNGALSGGGGFADSYYQPIILGWRKHRVGIRAISGFLAPTGKIQCGRQHECRFGLLDSGCGEWTDDISE